MKHKIIQYFTLLLLIAGLTACHSESKQAKERRYDFPNILDIAYTPDNQHRCYGWFTDAGSWMGFTIPEKDKWVNGFCGPFSLDMFRRQWMAQSATVVSFSNQTADPFIPDSTCYYPGELYLSAHSKQGTITQRLNFVNATTALLRIET
ncbi:lipoprotein, partial [gut metagenome]